MSNMIKLFFLASVIVLLVTGGVIFSIPELRNKILHGKDAARPETPAVIPDISDREILTPADVFALEKSLREREKKIREEEARIERLKGVLEEEKTYIENVKAEVEKMHNNISSFIPMITEGEQKNLKKLAKMFETLSPESANPIMARMPDQTLVIVLSYMKPRSSAKLLAGYAASNSESARRAAEMTEKLKNLVMDKT